MTWIANVEYSPFLGLFEVTLARRSNDAYEAVIGTWRGQGVTVERVLEGVEVQPFMALSRDAAQALVTALSKHVQTDEAEQTQSVLRETLGVERARVDRVLDRLLGDLI